MKNKRKKKGRVARRIALAKFSRRVAVSDAHATYRFSVRYLLHLAEYSRIHLFASAYTYIKASLISALKITAVTGVPSAEARRTEDH